MGWVVWVRVRRVTAAVTLTWRWDAITRVRLAPVRLAVPAAMSPPRIMIAIRPIVTAAPVPHPVTPHRSVPNIPLAVPTMPTTTVTVGVVYDAPIPIHAVSVASVLVIAIHTTMSSPVAIPRMTVPSAVPTVPTIAVIPTAGVARVTV